MNIKTKVYLTDISDSIVEIESYFIDNKHDFYKFK